MGVGDNSEEGHNHCCIRINTTLLLIVGEESSILWLSEIAVIIDAFPLMYA